MIKSKPLTATERSQRTKEKKLAEGWRRMPSGLLSPEASGALDYLIESGYAPGAASAITKALLSAAKSRQK